MPIDSSHPATEPFWPLQVTLRRTRVERGLWEADSWSVVAVASDRGQRRPQLHREALPAQGHCQDYCWSGLGLELFRDERGAYRFNLSAAEPRLFVICCHDEAQDCMRPYLISASQDAAASYMDGGDEDVFSVSMPPALQCWIEAFIARHGEPELGLSQGKRRRYRGARKQEAGDA